MIEEEAQQLYQFNHTLKTQNLTNSKDTSLQRVITLMKIKPILLLSICIISLALISVIISQKLKINEFIFRQKEDIQKRKEIQPVKQQTKTQMFQIKKTLWLFHSDKPRDLLQNLYLQNNIYFSQLSGFQIQYLNQTNLVQFLSDENIQQLNNLQKKFREKAQNGDRNLNIKIESIISNIGLLYIIYNNGGILLNGYYCLTQTFDWMKDLRKNIHAKRGSNNVNPQVFAFYNPQLSSPLKKENIQVNYQVQKYIRAYPGLMPYFIAAQQKAKFIKDVIEEILSILYNPQLVLNSQGEFNLFGVNPNDVYGSYFSIAVHRVLQRKQRELDLTSSQYKLLAVDFYKLYYITEYASANKFFVFFNDARSKVQFQLMTKHTAQQWTELVGPFRQLTRLTPHSIMTQLIKELIKGKKDPMIKGSFLQLLLYPNSNQRFIIENPEKPLTNETNQPWSSLSKNVWVYWHNGIENAPLDNQVCVYNMRTKVQQSGFKLHIVSENNLHKFLSQDYIDKIQYSLKNSKVKTFSQSKPDLIRLALLAQHGGIYFDVSYILLTNIDWIVNIGRFPTQYIFNRYSHLPKVLMHFHPQYGGVFDWRVNQAFNTKVQWHLPYQNNFIAAEKRSQFIIQWFQLLLSFYLMPYQQVGKTMVDNLVFERWDNEYLMPMDALQCVIGRRQKQIRENRTLEWVDASDYYKIWGISGYMGIQKYRDRYGLESFRKPDNIFVYRYSKEYVQGFIGKNFNLVKFYSEQNEPMSKFIEKNKDDNFTKEAHPFSLFSQDLIDPDIQFYYEGRWKVRQNYS